jgi:hypothetical protein
MFSDKPRSTKHSGAVQSNSPVQPKQSSPKKARPVVMQQPRAKDNPGSSHDKKPSLPPLGSNTALPAHPATCLAVPESSVPASSMRMNAQQFAASQEATPGFDVGTNVGSGTSTSMNTLFVDTRGILGSGSLQDMHGISQPSPKRAKVGENVILPPGMLHCTLIVLTLCLAHWSVQTPV